MRKETFKVDTSYKSNLYKKYLVFIDNEDILRAYLDDLSKERKYVKRSYARTWFEDFFNLIYGYVPFDLKRPVFYRDIYSFLGISEVRDSGELKGIWWPLWVDSWFPDIKSVRFTLNRSKTPCEVPVIHRMYPRCTTTLCTETDILSRIVWSLGKRVSLDLMQGYEVDHIARFVNCAVLANLNLVPASDNCGKRERAYSDFSDKLFYRGVTIIRNSYKFSISIKHYTTGAKVCISFPCPKILAVLLYDYIFYYLYEVPNYYWQFRELKETDIYGLVDLLEEKSYQKFLEILWNLNDKGRDLVFKLFSHRKCEIHYDNLDSYKSRYYYKTFYVGEDGMPIRFEISVFDRKDLIVRFTYYHKIHIMGVKTILYPPFMTLSDNYDQFTKILDMLGCRDKYRSFLIELNKRYKKTKGKLTEFISSLN